MWMWTLQSRKINFTKPVVNPNQKNVEPLEIDKRNVAVAAPEFVIVDSDHDQDEDIDFMKLTLVEFIYLPLIIT